MIHRVRQLTRELLGLNRRNHDVIARYNPRALFQVVDHKLKTKAALAAFGISVAETLAVYRLQREIADFAVHAQAWEEFVIKPAQGAGGEGVIVITGRRDEKFLTGSGNTLSLLDVKAHLSDILGGVFSLNQRYDEALIERRIHAHPVLAQRSFQGLPDIRVLILRGIPLMAMLRVATQTSKGRANLHVGGIGVGIDLTTGTTTYAVVGKTWLTTHPDTQQALCGIQIPCWEDLLVLAARCADAVTLGYLGVDLTIDAEGKPYVLELNARPGLSIQLANRRGLRPFIEEVERHNPQGLTVGERVYLGQTIAKSCSLV